MKTKITDSSVETNEFRLNHREEFTWFKNIITQDDADEYGYSEEYDQDDSEYEYDMFYSEIVTDFHDSNNYIAKEIRDYDVPENLQEFGFRIVTPYQWWETPEKDPNNPIAPPPTGWELESTGSTTNLLKGFKTFIRGGGHTRLNYASVGTDEVIVLPLNEGEISDSGFFDGIKKLDTAYFGKQAEAYCEDLSVYLYDTIPALAFDSILEEEKVSVPHGVEVTKIYFQAFYGETAPIDDFNRMKEWEPLDFRYDGMTPGEVFGFECNFIYDYNNSYTIWKGSNTDTLEWCLTNGVSNNYFTFEISYDSGGITISDVKWRYEPNGSDFYEDVLANFGPVTFAIVGFEGSLLYPKFQIKHDHYIPTGEEVQLELNKYSLSYEQISLIGYGFTPVSQSVDEGLSSSCHYIIKEPSEFLFIDQGPKLQPGVCFNLWIYNDHELPEDLANGVEWQITLKAHSGKNSKISASSTLLPFNVRIPHILYNKNLYKQGYATLSNTIKDDKTYATLSKLFISNVTTQDLDGDGITTSKDQIFAHDGSINTINTKLKNVKITRLKGGKVYDPDKE